MALLYWAFKISYRRGELSERIRIDDRNMTVERVAPGNRRQTWLFHPAWVRVEVVRPEDHDAQLSLREKDQSVEIGSFLPPRERSEVAGVIRDGLNRRRGALLAGELV